MNRLNVIVCLLILMLSGCGGESVPSDGETGGGNGGGTISPPPVVPPSSESIRAADFHLTFDTNTTIDSLNVNFSTFVSSTENKPLTVTEVSPLSSDPHCQVLGIDSQLQQFSVSPQSAKTCIYRYVVTDGETSSESLGRVTFTAENTLQEGTRIREGSVSPTALSTVSKQTVVGETLEFSLADELSSELSTMTNPLFSEAITAYGTGVPTITEAGDVTYSAISAGSSLTYFYVLDDKNTADKNDDVIYDGTLIIDVSDKNALPPNADDAEYSTLVPAGNEVEIDITDFEGSSLVSDPSGAPLQLIAVSTTNAFVTLSDPMDVTNTKFRFKSDLYGQFKISYAVYNHNSNGVASGEITLNVGHTLGGKVVFTQYGYGKLFDGNDFGVYSTNAQAVEFYKNTVEPFIKEKDLTVEDVYPVNNWSLGLKLSNESLLIFSLIAVNELYTEHYYKFFPDYKDFTISPIYANEKLGNSRIVTTIVIRKDGSLEAFSSPNTIYSNNNHELVEEAVEKINGSFIDIKMIDDYSFIAIKEDGASTIFLWDSKIKDYSEVDVSKNYNFELSTITMISETMPVAQSSDGRMVKFTNESQSVIDFLIENNISIKKILSNSDSVAILTDKSELFEGNNRLYFFLKDGIDFKSVDADIVNMKSSSYFVVYQKRDGELNGLSYDHKIAVDSSTPFTDITLNFNLLTEEERNDVEQYQVSSDAVIIIRETDGKSAIFDFSGYRNTGIITKQIVAEFNTGGGFYATENPHYFGRNTFLLQLPDDTWFYEQAVKVDGFVRSSPDLSSVKPTDSLVLITSNNLVTFHNTGAISAKYFYAYPEDKFKPSDFLFPINDIDLDGLSNCVEMDSCVSSINTSYSFDFSCLNPALKDTDGDAVSDGFENKYHASKNSNFLTPFSYIDSGYSYDGEVNIIDTYKDVNANGVIDWME